MFKPSIIFALLCSFIFTGKAYLLKYYMKLGYEPSQIIFDYQALNAIGYCLLGMLVYFPSALATNTEMTMGFFGGMFDIMGSTLFGISLATGPGGLV